MTDTPRLGITQYEEEQALPENVGNEGFRILEAFANATHFKSRTTTAEPATPADGDVYLLPSSSTGTNWAGHDGEIAIFINTAWEFRDAKEGFIAWVDDDDELVIFDGSTWNAFNPAAGAVGSSGLTMSTARLLGRTTASTGAIEEITVGSGLSLAAGTLSATGGGATIDIEDEGVAEATASTLNFTGAGVTATDAGGGVVDIDIPGGGGGALVLIDEELPSGVGTVTFSSLGSYRNLRIVVTGKGSAAGSGGLVECRMRFNSDTGSNYDDELHQGAATSSTAAAVAAATSNLICFLPGSGVANYPGGVILDILDYRGTSFYKEALGNYGFYDGSARYRGAKTHWWKNTAAITAVEIFLNTGNFATGSVVSIYGWN